MRFTRLLFQLCLGCLVLGSSLAASAQITPSQDAYTNSAAPTTNFGTATTLGVANTSTSIQNAYIQFDLSSIPTAYTGANVGKATLKLYVNAATTAGSFNVDFINGSWSEKTITYNLAPALGSTIVSSVSLPTADKNSFLLIDITSALQAWLNGTQTNDGIALVANSPLSATFDSNENTAQSHPPELDVVFNGAIRGVNTAAGSGLTGGGTSGTLNLSLLTTCSSGQILAWNGSAWACQTVNGTGTVTSVGLSAPASDFSVTGSPVTTSGTLGLNWTVAPTPNNTANAIVKRDSGGSFNTSSITASGQISIDSGVSLNPISAIARAGNAAAIAAYSLGTGVTDGVIASTVSSTQASSGVLGIDQNNAGSAGSYTAGVTGRTYSSFGVGVLGFGTFSNNGTGNIGYSRVGVWGDDASGTGVVASSDSGSALNAFNTSTTPTLTAVNNSTGSAEFAFNTSTTNPTLIAENNTSASNGLIFRATAPNVQSNGSPAFCQISTHGDMGCTGDVFQNSPANGLAKALVYFDPAQPAGSQIVRCFNSTVLEPAASTPPCGFTNNHLNIGINRIDFGFPVNGRFPQVTAVLNGTEHQVGANVDNFTEVSTTQLTVHTYYIATGNETDTPFYLTVF